MVKRCRKRAQGEGRSRGRVRGARAIPRGRVYLCSVQDPAGSIRSLLEYNGPGQEIFEG